MRLPVLAAVLLLAACGGGGGGGGDGGVVAGHTETAAPTRPALPSLVEATATTPGMESDLATSITEVERVEFSLLLEDVRGDLRRVTAHSILNEVAQVYTADIVSSGRTIASGDNLHVGRDGSTVSDRVLAAGYDYAWLGENIAQGYKTGQEVIDAWMASDRGHREVILAPEAEDFGIGRTDETWVLIMGAER